MKIVFMGTPDFAVPTLRVLCEKADVVAVFTQPDRPVGRGLKLQSSPVKLEAQIRGIPIFTPEKISTPEEISHLLSYQADFFVVVAYGQILKQAVIDLPRYGCVNIHSSLLPRWRGAAPIQWSLWSGDNATGVTTMKIVRKLDAGDILMQEETLISADDTAETLHNRLSQMGAGMIMQTLTGVMEGTIIPTQQDEQAVTYAHKLEKEMGLLSCMKSAEEIDRTVRALNPWPGTWVVTKDGIKFKVKVGSPRVGMSRETVGRLFTLHGDLYFQTTRGAYQIFELQEEGKKSVLVPDFLNGLQGRGLSLPMELI